MENALKAVREGDHKTNVQARRLGIDDEGAKLIAAALKTSKIKSLYLQENKIGPDGAKALAEALYVNKILETLDVRGNKIGVSGAYYFSKALADNVHLPTLYVGDDSGVAKTETLLFAETILSGLKSNMCLTWLTLQAPFGSKAATLLSELLATNKTLDHLNLGFSQIGAEEMKIIAQGIAKNSTLSWLDLSFCHVGFEGIYALTLVLATHPALRHYEIGGNDLSEAEGRQLLTLLTPNHTIRSFSCHSNNFSPTLEAAFSDWEKRNSREWREAKAEEKKATKSSEPKKSNQTNAPVEEAEGGFLLPLLAVTVLAVVIGAAYVYRKN